MSINEEFKKRIKHIEHTMRFDRQTKIAFDKVMAFWDLNEPDYCEENAMKQIMDFWDSEKFTEEVSRAVITVISFWDKGTNEYGIQQAMNKVMSSWNTLPCCEENLSIDNKFDCSCLIGCFDTCCPSDKLLKFMLLLLLNKKFGLREIKSEVADIEALLHSSTIGLAEIKTEIFDIINNPSYGLIEIKSEIFGIEMSMIQFNQIISLLESPTIGLAEIKTEVFDIEQLIHSPTIGLAEIKTEIFDIEQLLHSPTIGLAEIKTEIFALEQKILCNVTRITTGLVQRVDPNNNDDFFVQVLNTTTNTLSVTVSVFDYTICPGAETFSTPTLFVIPGHCVECLAVISLDSDVLEKYSIVIEGVEEGIYAWASIIPPTGKDTASNSFKSVQFVPYFD